MKVLALDTTTNAACAAVTEDTRLLGSVTLNLKKPHSQKIMPLVQDLLSQLELSLSDIDLFCCANGPGSFTGIRIGVAAVKGFSFALKKPSVGVSALKALAFPFAIFDGLVCPVMDARRRQVYYGLYFQGNERVSPQVSDINALAQALAEKEKGPILFTGNAVSIYRKEIAGILGKRAIFPPEAFAVNSAVSIALISREMYLASPSLPPLMPEYLMKSYVERKDQA